MGKFIIAEQSAIAHFYLESFTLNKPVSQHMKGWSAFLRRGLPKYTTQNGYCGCRGA